MSPVHFLQLDYPNGYVVRYREEVIGLIKENVFGVTWRDRTHLGLVINRASSHFNGIEYVCHLLRQQSGRAHNAFEHH